MQGLTGLVLMDFRFLAPLGMTDCEVGCAKDAPTQKISPQPGERNRGGLALGLRYERNTAIPAWGKTTSRFPWRSRCIVIR